MPKRSLSVASLLSGREHDLDPPDEPEDEWYEDDPDPDDEYERRLERNGFRSMGPMD